ncbi:BppU family phage baseplate upper protein [Clostridium perfringens]|uniref:BppU family phage baseplate upper protein n=1 Tax=Clostridium perfringens TaxID=1502 RepID=UPI0039EC2A3D
MKEIIVNVDSYNENSIRTVEGDNLSEVYKIYICKNKRRIDLTNKIAVMAYVNEYGNKKSNILALNITNASQGEIELPITNVISNENGVYACQIAIYGENNSLEQTAPFSLIVENNIFSKISNTAINSTDFHILSEAIKTTNKYSEILKQGTENIEFKYADKLNEINLKLSNKENELYVNQEDFCERIKNLYKPQSMMLKVNDYQTKVFSIINKINNEKAIQYSTRTASFGSVQDGYILFGEGRYGELEKQYLLTNQNCADEMKGSWNKSYNPSYYATKPGDTMTKKFIGSKIDFFTFGDNRGGIWEFIIDNDEKNKVILSTWKETPGVIPARTIFEDLDYKEHTLLATFKGDDPEHIPSGGSGTSRGWTYCNDGENAINSFYIYKKTLNVNEVVTPLFGTSNKEFAFEVRKSGTNNPFHFCPYHDAVTAFKIEEPIFKINEENVELKTGDVYENIKDFSITQRIYAKNPESEDRLAEITTITSFKDDGTVTVDGKYKALTDLDIKSAYGIMWVLDANFNTKIVSSINKEYITSDTHVGNNLILEEESDKTTSFASISEDYKNIVTAVTFNNPKNTLRSGLGGKIKNPTWIEYRNSTLTKLYQQVYGKTAIKAGETYKFSGTFIVGEIYNIYYLL